MRDWLASNITLYWTSPLLTAVQILIVMISLILIMAFYTLAERKVIGWIQARKGPNRVKLLFLPGGLGQPFADVFKLIFKEIVIPADASGFLFRLAPFLALVPALAIWAVIPFAPEHAFSHIDAGLLYILALTSMGVYGIILAGWAANSKYAFLGAMRSAAQIVAYEIAMGFAMVGVLMASGSLNVGTIIERQHGGMLSWNWFWLFPLLIVYFISGVAETNRAPFDLAEAESELTAGFHTEYSGFRWSLFFLAEYSAMIAVSSIAVTLWLGGWLRPFPNLLNGDTWEQAFSFVPGITFLFFAAMCFYNAARMPKHPLFRVQTIGLFGFGVVLGLIGLVLFVPAVSIRVQDIFWFAAKVSGFMYFYIWFRGTFPRYRFDQLMRIGWKVLLPMGLGVLILTATFGLWPSIQQMIWHP